MIDIAGHAELNVKIIGHFILHPVSAIPGGPVDSYRKV